VASTSTKDPNFCAGLALLHLLTNIFQFGFDAKDRFFHARAFDGLAIIHWGQATDIPFRDSTWGVNTGRIHSFDETLTTWIDGSFMRLTQVLGSIFGSGHRASDRDGGGEGVVRC
jgi:hypothetical protein